MDYAAANEFRRTLKNLAKRRRECMYVDASGKACSRRALANSHCIQRKGPLAAIQESGHVYGFTYNPVPTEHKEIASLELIGWKRASVFPGFCEKHDGELFASFEKGTSDLTPLDVHRMAYRSLCMELYHVQTGIDAHETFKRSSTAGVRRISELSRDFFEEAQYAKRDLMLAKAVFEQGLHSGRLDGFRAVAVVLKQNLPFCFTSFIAPPFDLNDNAILPAVGDIWNKICWVGGSFAGRYIMIFGGYEMNERHGVSRFLESVTQWPRDRFSDLGLHVALRYAQKSVYFSPAWIDAAGPSFRDKLAELHLLTLGDGPLTPANRFSNMLIGFSSSSHVDEIRTFG